MDRYTILYFGSFNFISMKILPKLLYKFNAISIKITTGFFFSFLEFDKLIKKYIYAKQEAKSSFRKARFPLCVCVCVIVL